MNGDDPKDENDSSRKDLIRAIDDKSNFQEIQPTNHKSITRRGAIKLGAIGAGILSGIPYVKADSSLIEIPERIYPDDGRRKYMQVPESWYDHVLEARSALETIEQQFSEESWFKNVGQAAHDEIIAEDLDGEKLKKHKIVVGVRSGFELKNVENELPEQVNGIQVEAREAFNFSDDSCDDTFSCVPSGANVSHGSAGPLTRWHDGNSWDRYMALTAHTFVDDECWGDLTGQTVWHGGQTFGEVATYSWEHDLVLVDNSGTLDGIDNRIYGGSWDATSFYHENTVDQHISQEKTSYHYGNTTCFTSGSLMFKCKESNSSDACDGVYLPSVWWIFTEAEADDGDSGGPHFGIDIEEDEEIFYGMHKSSWWDEGIHQRSRMLAAFGLWEDEDMGMGSVINNC